MSKFIKFFIIAVASLIGLVIVYGFLFNPWSPLSGLLYKEEYMSTDIGQLIKDVPFVAGTPHKLPKEKWVKLKIIEGFSDVEKVEYVYRPARGDLSAYLSARVELKQLLNPVELDTILEKNIKEKGLKYTKNSYFAIDVNKHGNISYSFCDSDDKFYLEYGDWSDDTYPTKTVRFSMLTEACNI